MATNSALYLLKVLGNKLPNTSVRIIEKIGNMPIYFALFKLYKSITS